MLFAQSKFFIFGSLNSFDSKLRPLSNFYLNQHSDAGTMQLPYFQLVLLSQLSPGSSFKSPPYFLSPYFSHIHDHSCGKMFYRILCVGSKHKEFPIHE
jgi:hypothetical protein